MTDKTPPTLDRLWEDIPAGPAPIAELLDAGKSATRRRRRAVIAGAVAATALVLGLGGLTAQVLGLGSDRSSGPIAGTSGDLSVSIAYNDGGASAADPNPDGATHDNAVWDPDTDVVYYASGLGYSGSCPPTGTATRTDAGVLTLHLAEYHGGGACTSDARGVIAAIHGVTHLPAGLTVTELGETRDVTVTAADVPEGPAPSEATRQVGIGRVAVSVPAAWAENAASCNSPFKDTAFFPWPQDCALAQSRAVSSVAITTGEFTETGTRLGDLQPAGSLGDHQVVQSPPNCLQGFPASGQGSSTHCTQTFGIPDLHAYFTASIIGNDAEHRLNAIRESLTVLPEDQVTVPFVTPGTSLDGVRAALETAGLSVDVVRWTCPPTADCVGGVDIDDPTVGSVVPAGSTVTVKVLDNEGSPGDQQSPCGPNDVCEKAPADTFVPDCQGHSRAQATFDIFDDTAAATPELAVAPMLAADERASAAQDVDAGMVRIALLRADGTTRAVVTVERIETGWRPYTIDGCPGETR